jgi:hypothetical protein
MGDSMTCFRILQFQYIGLEAVPSNASYPAEMARFFWSFYDLGFSERRSQNLSNGTNDTR